MNIYMPIKNNNNSIVPGKNYQNQNLYIDKDAHPMGRNYCSDQTYKGCVYGCKVSNQIPNESINCYNICNQYVETSYPTLNQNYQEILDRKTK